jgi:hypothetical protein
VKKTVAAVMLFVLGGAGAFAENGNLQAKSETDWANGKLRLQITVRLDLDRLQFPEARRAAEKQAEEGRGDLFLDAFSGVTLDSSETVGQFLADSDKILFQRRVVDALPALCAAGVKAVSVVSDDFKSVSVVYEYSFYGAGGLLAPFVAQDQPLPLPAMPGYYATRPFSGLVIDARGQIAGFGKNTKVSCKPALFPRIFYLSARQTIEPVLDMTMADPRAIRKWGMVGYARSADKGAYAPRAGSDPLAVVAFAVYGTNDTDLVISEDAARLLLSNEENRELLRQGKIVVIID